MLSVMCPNCRHRFPAPGCCNPVVVAGSRENNEFTNCESGSYCTGNTTDYLVPRGYHLNGGGGCVINSTTVINGQNFDNGLNSMWIQQQQQSSDKNIRSSQQLNCSDLSIPSHCQIATTTGGTLAMTNNKNIINNMNNNNNNNNNNSNNHNNNNNNNKQNNKNNNKFDKAEEESPNFQSGLFQNPHPMLFRQSNETPSGCQELPGSRADGIIMKNNSLDFNRTTSTAFDFQINEEADWTGTKNVIWPINSNNTMTSGGFGSSSSSSSSSGSSSSCNLVPNLNLLSNNAKSSSSGTVIQLNATLQLPPNVANCTLSITATANTTVPISNCNRTRNNFNGGGIVENDSINLTSNIICDRDTENSPTTPVSWVLPFPWGINGNSSNSSNNVTDLERLSAAQRVLQISGWYHEGLSFKQSEALLKNSPVGSWLMRDSSDKRYMYAVSVQTANGPTAVRVHYVCGRFRLDAQPGMAPLMPMFECPVKMIEHYIKYSDKMAEQKEVWVDHSGQVYSRIYLTKPLLKEVRSLSHIARLVVNRNNISTKLLPPSLKEYIADYPYTE